MIEYSVSKSIDMSFIISLIMLFVAPFLIIAIYKIKKKHTHNDHSDDDSVKFDSFLMNIMLILTITIFIVFSILIILVISDNENSYNNENSYSYNSENSYNSKSSHNDDKSILKSDRYTVSDLNLTIEKITVSDGRDVSELSQDELYFMGENEEPFTVKFSEGDVFDEIIIKRSDMYVTEQEGRGSYSRTTHKETYGTKKFDNMIKTYSDNGQVKVTLNDRPVNDKVTNLHFKLENMDVDSKIYKTYLFKDNRVEFN